MVLNGRTWQKSHRHVSPPVPPNGSPFSPSSHPFLPGASQPSPFLVFALCVSFYTGYLCISCFPFFLTHGSQRRRGALWHLLSPLVHPGNHCFISQNSPPFFFSQLHSIIPCAAGRAFPAALLCGHCGCFQYFVITNSVFPFIASRSWITIRKPFRSAGLWRHSPVFSLGSSVVPYFMFGFLIQLEFIVVCAGRHIPHRPGG